MSRGQSQAARNLTLTEELEKLEQSITLTLQEIDHNFSRAHRIVTSSILPIVEQYAKHSEAVWEGSKFWKQFFEASANVSLSGYEEAAVDDVDDDDATYADQSTTAGASSAFGSRTTTPVDDTITTDKYRSDGEGDGRVDLEGEVDESLLTSPSAVHASSTPHVRGQTPKSKSKAKLVSKSKSAAATFTNYDSPYESLRREMQGSSSPAAVPPTSTVMPMDPITPGKQASAIPDMSMTPSSSPFAIPPSATQQPLSGRKANNDILMHRVLDKTYRIAATPHTARKTTKPQDYAKAGTPGITTRTGTTRYLDLSPASSPEMPAPQLRADLFSPAKSRIPGVSVQHTPGFKRRRSKSAAGIEGEADTKDVFGRGHAAGGATRTRIWDSDSDDDTNDLGFSPPKTMQFHIPQSRILQTPAREAAKGIVEDLLLTAGGDITDEFDEREGLGDDDSPSVVRKKDALDDSF